MLRIGCRAAIAAHQYLAVIGDAIEEQLRAFGNGLGQLILDLQLELGAVFEMLDDAFVNIHLFDVPVSSANINLKLHKGAWLKI